MAQRVDIEQFCAQFLETDQFRDAAINGVQVEGRTQINQMSVAVSASELTIQSAIDRGDDALLVHHGLLWGERLSAITGPMRRRLALLLRNDITLFAYHLPLDAHPKVGNNAELARSLEMDVREPFAQIAGRAIGLIAEPRHPVKLTDLIEQLVIVTKQPPIVLGPSKPDVTRVAILSGSGYSAMDEAIAKGCDLLITGDVREPTMALAREVGITVIAAGHEATERQGVQALAMTLAEEFNIQTQFIDDPNPI